MSDSNRLALAETDQVTSVGVTPPSCAVSRQQNADVLIWLRPREEVSEASPAMFAPPQLDAHHPGQGRGRRASSCHANPEDYDEMRCAENDVASRFGSVDGIVLRSSEDPRPRAEGDPDASARQLA
jgi:hypothetical protein